MNIEVRQEDFKRAYQNIVTKEKKRESIGTLGEKTIHAVLKDYLEPEKGKQEKKIGSYVADIFDGEEIIEIQTKQFQKLREKLAYFVPRYPVTIVYPVEKQKRLFWIDKNTKEVSGGRISPRKGNPYEIFTELYKIERFLESIKIKIILLEVEEYRILDGWSADKKKGATKVDKIPIKIEQEIYIEKKEDYMEFIPEEINKEFDSKEFAKKANIKRKSAQICLNILTKMKLVNRVGKKGNAYLYQRVE